MVEDDCDLGDTLIEMLAARGYEARGALNGRAALEALESWPADVIVLDLAMPVLSGPAFRAEQWRRGLAPLARLIVLSAAERTHEAAEALGAFAALTKPFSLRRLEEVLRRATSSADRRTPPSPSTYRPRRGDRS